MVFLILFVVVFVTFGIPYLSQRKLARVRGSGLEARGLILSASKTSAELRVNGQRFEQRAVVLDVEVPGQPPYEVSLTASFPRMCEAFPGAALDLRVDPRNRNLVTVVGVAGASNWVGATVGLFPWAPAAGPGRGCAMLVLGVVLALLAMGAVISLTR